jgi:uncharacterized protein (TIGR02284 family)
MKGKSMETDELIRQLQDLVQADIDTVHAYNRVLDDISDDILRSRLTAFRDNHLEHIDAISDAIETLGGEAPDPAKDFKGHVMEAFAALRTTAGGTKSALKALRTVEELTNRHYEQIFVQDVSPDLKQVLRKQFSEENLHLDYINENLKSL